MVLGALRNPPLTQLLLLSLSADPPPVSLVPNEQQLARLTDYVAFLENWTSTSAVVPLSFCVDSNLDRHLFPLAAKTPYPIKMKQRRTHSTSTSCWLSSTQQLPSLIRIHRLGLCAFCSCSPAYIYNSIWHLDEAGPFGRGMEAKKVKFRFFRARNM